LPLSRFSCDYANNILQLKGLTMVTNDNFIKTYSDRPYQYSTMVRHKGTVIAFAMEVPSSTETSRRRIYYSALDLKSPNVSPLDRDNWLKNPHELSFPNEISLVGFGIADQSAMPVVRKNGAEVTDTSAIQEEEKDAFLSSTGRLTADAPFQVLSDGKYVCVFRQSLDQQHQDMVFKRDADGEFVTDKNGDKVPLVDETLLLDRFVLVGTRLKSKLEVRYQRSRSKHRPQSRKDSLSARDMEDTPFHEPTQELGFIRNLTQGRFSVLQLPSKIPGQHRWQMFAHNKKTDLIDSFNIERAADGLFNTQGTQFYTCPEHPDVFESKPGKCPHDNKTELVPIVSNEGYAETALSFTGADGAFLEMPQPISSDSGAIELWIKFSKGKNQTIFDASRSAAKNDSGNESGKYFFIDRRGSRLRFGLEDALDDDFKLSTHAPARNTWHHIAAVWNYNDAPAAQLYIDGELVAEDTRTAGARPEFLNPYIGQSRSGYITEGAFCGEIDEVRIWNRARSAREINADRQHRLIGNELGLFGYWRLDAGSGTTAHDQTEFAHHGTLHGELAWISSSAPIGDHPGIRRTSFSFANRRIASGLSALLYYQQEKAPTGYDGQVKPLKKNARVMLSVATDGGLPDKHEIATLDFAVTREGKLPQIPDNIALPTIDKPESINTLLDRIDATETELKTLHEDIHSLRAQQRALHDQIAILGQDPSQVQQDIIDLENSIKTLQAEIDAFANQHKGEVVHFYAEKKFNGNSLALNVGKVNQASLNKQLAAQDIRSIKSIELPQSGSRRVILFGLQEEIEELESTTLESSVVDLSVLWDGEVSALEITASSQHTQALSDVEAVLAERLAELEHINQHAGDLPQKKTELEALSTELSAKSRQLGRVQRQLEQLNIAATLGVPMPLIHVDPKGLIISGALLQFAWSRSTPQLFDSANGKLALYFRGDADQFFAAYFDTLTEKAQYQLNENIVLAARSAGPELETARISLSRGKSKRTCTLNIVVDRLGVSETWLELPRDTKKFIRIFNGEANTSDPKDPFYYNYQDRSVAGSALSIDVRGSLLFVALSNDLPELKNGSLVSDRLIDHSLGRLAQPLVGVVKSLQLETGIVDDQFSGTRLWVGNSLVYLLEDAPAGTAELKISQVIFSTPVEQGSYIHISTTRAAEWVADRPGKALLFDGQDDYLSLDKQSPAAPFEIEGDLTMETWVKPDGIGQPGPGASLIHQHSVGSRYSLGLGAPAALVFNGRDEYIDFGSVLNVNGKNWSIELWFRCDRIQGHNILYNKESLYEAAVNDGYFQYAWQPHWHWDGGTSFPVREGKWYHVAVVYDGQTQSIYRNGKRIYNRLQRGSIASNNKKLRIAARGTRSPWAWFQGQIDEFRIWDTARRPEQIQADLQRRLKGDERHLVGYWHFENRTAHDFSGRKHHGKLIGAPRNPGCFAQVGDKAVSWKHDLPLKRWTHLTAAFNQSYALQFNASAEAHLDCGNNTTLNINQDLTLEVFLKVNRWDCGILSKGKLDDGTDEDVPYSLSINRDGKLSFVFEDENHINHTFRSQTVVQRGRFYRIAVTRKHQIKTEQKNSKVTVKEWDDIRFYIGEHRHGQTYDIKQAGHDLYEGASAGSNNQVLYLGQSFQSGGRQSFFEGVISEVRIWNTTRAAADVCGQIKGREKGLISWWRMEEREGNVAFDSRGTNHAIRSAALWIKNPDPVGSSFVLYQDGVPVSVEPMQGLNGGKRQFTLGAKWTDSVQQHFQGKLEEVRIWKTLRTEEQIQDNLFRSLVGEKEDLIAYYRFDDEDRDIVKDESFNGNHLPRGTGNNQATFVLSKAPVGNDSPQVRSALAGEGTAFNDVIHGRPGVEEYGDMQVNADGQLFGVMKRCYTFIKDDQWHLITGFKVGNLSTEWIGQAQANPQLMGYIEGPPPVPSENLTTPPNSTNSSYDGASSVQVIEADNLNYVYSASEESGFDTVFDLKLVAGFKSQSEAGFGLTTTVEETNVTAGIKGHFESSNSQLRDSNIAVGSNTTKTSRMDLTGSWEAPRKVLNRALGRRFVPKNLGLALVQSDTVDIFALRLKHNNALVSYWMRPNPDIPKDWNIITFQINPGYTEQGTLDGKIGFQTDGSVQTSPNYPNAAQYGEWSYFKPREAYAIKSRIERDDQELKNFYANHHVAQGRGAEEGALIGAVAGGVVGANLGAAIGGALSSSATLPDEELKKLAKRNIANTYVWTASGGFFELATQVMETRQNSFGGAYSLAGNAGITTEVNTAISKVAVGFEMDALFGGHWSVTTTKSETSEESFRINISLDIERNIQRHVNGTPVYDKTGAPVDQPGKVDAYRFMTFYLQPSLTHFDEFTNKVVDSVWLEQSEDPNAVALRQAVAAQQQAKKEDKSLPWRVMHRVTYVSRILPESRARNAPPLERAMKASDVSSHYQLILKLEPFVRDKTGEEFDNAVRNTLKEYLPKLIPHSNDIIQYLRQYLDVPEKETG